MPFTGCTSELNAESLIFRSGRILPFAEMKLLAKEEKGVFLNDPSKTRWPFFPALCTMTFGIKNILAKKSSSQHGNATTHLLHSSFLMVFSTLYRCLVPEA